MQPRGAPRLGLGGTLVVAAAVALLAAGFGLLGGRPEPTVGPTLVPRPTRTLPPRITFAAPTPAIAAPQVTPWTECGSEPLEPPTVLLEVGGRPTTGTLEAVSFRPPGTGPSAGPPQQAPERIPVRPDVHAELWIDDAACATAWTITLSTREVLDSVTNPQHDRSYAAQNRFALPLAPYAGRDVVLRAALAFEQLDVIVSWPLSIAPLDHPEVELHAGSTVLPVTEGCDIYLTLANGYREELNPCGRVDVIGLATPIRRGEPIELVIEGFEIDAAELICGALVDGSFVALPQPGCRVESSRRRAAYFEGDLPAGAWVLAVAACATQALPDAVNQVCGTWFANVEVS